MADTQAPEVTDSADGDTILNTFQAVKIGTSVLPAQVIDNDSTPAKEKNDMNYQCNCPLPIFLPFGRYIFIWNAFLFIILIYSIVEIPYSIAFQTTSTADSFIAIFGLLIDLCLLFDIILNFRTAYIDKYDRLRIIHEPKLIARKYIKTWFIIDFLSSTPFSYIILLLSNSGNYSTDPIFTFFRLLRIIKLVRILKILKMFHIFRENSFNTPINRTLRTITKLMRIIALMLLTAHYFACFWYGIGLWAHKNNHNSWIDLIIENGDENENNFIKYSYAFYWSIVTLFTTGYGDIHACNVYEHWTCSIGILIGSCFFAYFIGVLTRGIADDLPQQSRQRRIEQSLEFCRHFNLPKEITRAVLTHMRYYNSYNYLFDDDITMNVLPNHLQLQISQYLGMSVLKELDIFESLPHSIIGQIALKLKSKSVGENHLLYKCGDLGKELYIQRTGKSRLIYNGMANKSTDRNLKRGDVVGENAILWRKRQHSVICLMWSEFYVLNIYDIVHVLKDNYDPNTAKQEWIKIKNLIKNTKSVSNLYRNPSEISDDCGHSDAANLHRRHVRFKTIKMQDYQTYVDPKICDDVSNKTESIFDVITTTFSEEELALQKEEELREHSRKIKQRKRKKITFKSVKHLFLDQQRSHSRNRKVIKNYVRKKNVTNLAYSHVSLNDLDQGMDSDDYYFDNVETPQNQSQSGGFFHSPSNNIKEYHDNKTEPQETKKEEHVHSKECQIQNSKHQENRIELVLIENKKKVRHMNTKTMTKVMITPPHKLNKSSDSDFEGDVVS